MGLLLMLSLPKRGIAFDLRGVGGFAGRCAGSAVAAAVMGLAVAAVADKLVSAELVETLAVLVFGGLSLLASYAIMTHLLGISEGTDFLRFLQTWVRWRGRRPSPASSGSESLAPGTVPLPEERVPDRPKRDETDGSVP
jgi:hypothetical protein